MAVIEGTGNRLAWAKESSWGVDPGSTYTIVRKLVGAASTTTRTQIQSQEITTDRSITDIRLGTRQCRVTVPCELFYAGLLGQFDDFIESWMCRAWAAEGSPAAGTSCTVGTVADSTVFTFAATSPAAVAAGDWLKITGFAAGQLGNNGFFRVMSVAGAVLTLATPGYAKAGMVATVGSAVVATIMAYDYPGLVTKSIAFNEQQSDTSGSVQVVKGAFGAVANTFSLTINPNAIVQSNFDFMGKTFAVAASQATMASAALEIGGVAVSTPANFTTAPTNSPMTANDTLMRLVVDNVDVGTIANLTINGNNNIEELFPVGSLTPYTIAKGDSVVTGTMDVYMTDVSFWTNFQAETEMGISIRLMDPDNGTPTTQAAGKGYAIDIPNIRLTNVGENKDRAKVLYNVQWTALKNATASTKGKATPNIVVWRLV